MARTLIVAEAGIGIVALRFATLTLWAGRAENPRSAAWRPCMKQKQGIDVTLASDNTRDAYYAYGDLDLADPSGCNSHDAVGSSVGDWPASVNDRGQVHGIHRVGINPGRATPADLVIFESRNWSEFVSRPRSNRTVPCRSTYRHDAARPLLNWTVLGNFRYDPHSEAELARKIPDIAVNTAENAVRTKTVITSSEFSDTESATGSRHDRCCGFPQERIRGHAHFGRVLGTVSVTPRGGGTGNYRQAMPLAGGVVLDMMSLGTQSIDAATVVSNPARGWARSRKAGGLRLGRSVCRTGIRKFVIVNSHGGNSVLMTVVARNVCGKNHMPDHNELVQCGDGKPFMNKDPPIIDIHGGLSETSRVATALQPDLVDMTEAADFT